MAAEIRVDTIKGRSGINTLSFVGDGFSFDQSVGIGTTVVSDVVQAANAGKLAAGIVTCNTVFAANWTVQSGIVTANSGFNVGSAATISANGNATFAGIVTSSYFNGGTIKLGDGDQIIAGVGSDLKIYHDSSNSYIVDSGTGGLRLCASEFNVKNAANNEVQIRSTENGAVELAYDANVRVTTTTDGTDLGGTGCVGITKGTTGQRPGSPAAGDFRYNTTDGKFEGYTDEWGEIGGGGGAAETDVAVSSTSATAVYTIAHATYRSAYLIMQITQGSAYQVGRYLVIHDGTTATIVEESAIATGSMLGTFTAGIDGSNLKVYVNMGSASSATVTVLPNPVTV